MRARVLVTRRLPSSAIVRLEERSDVEIRAETDPLVERLRDKRAVVVVLPDRIDRSAMEAAPALAVIANVAVGYDNIDVAAARSRGVIVTNTPDVLTDATADFTWALILAVTRRLGEGERAIRAGRWAGWAFDSMLGSSLQGKQIGIVGLGRIGRAVAARAAAFGMSIAYSARSKKPVPGMEMMPLDKLLATSDVVSLHVPLAPETVHLIDQKALARMKRTAFLVNTTRGPVVDEAALVWALGERLIAGAALDVFEREPEVHPGLIGLESVVLAPHLGSATREARLAMANLAVDNVLAVLDGRPPHTPVP
jgi:glyoxylate reductase